MRNLFISLAIPIAFLFACEPEESIVLDQTNDTLIIYNNDTIHFNNEDGSDEITVQHEIDTLIINDVSDSQETPFITLSPSISVSYLFNETQNDSGNVVFQLIIAANPSESSKEKALNKDIEFAYDAFIDAYNNTNFTPLIPAFDTWAGGHIMIDYGNPKKEASIRIDIPFSQENVNSGDQLRFNVYGYIEALYGGEVINRYEYSLYTYEYAYFEPQ